MPLDQTDDSPPKMSKWVSWTTWKNCASTLLRGVFCRHWCIGLFLAKDWLFDVVLFGPRHVDFITFRAWCQLSEWVGAGEALCVDSINYELINTTMLGNFTTHILVSAIAGFIAAFPLVFWQGWLFVRPALKESERQSARGVASVPPSCSSGCGLGYYVIYRFPCSSSGTTSWGCQSRISVMSYMQPSPPSRWPPDWSFSFLWWCTSAGPAPYTDILKHTVGTHSSPSSFWCPDHAAGRHQPSTGFAACTRTLELSILIAKRVYRKRANA